MFRRTDQPRHPHTHPDDLHDHFADAALAVAFVWIMCVVLGICMYAGLLS